ncbi:dihydrofolate reductase-like domain-containing protein [Boletus edulis]|nr:dihydrofolate reductase-like domain-containing protein [Boletus edulis]
MSAAREFLLSVLPSQDIEKIPSVTLTFAQSLDGKIAGSHGRQLTLSGPDSMIMTHWMRAMHDAIVVGIGTAHNDDPQLNVRLIPEADKLHIKSPRPVVLDAYLRLRTDCKLLKNYRDGKGQQPWVFCASDPESACAERLARKSALEAAGAVVYEIPCVSGLLSILGLLRKLHECDIRSVMVEGGASVINTFMNQASQPRGPGEPPVVDTLIVTVAPTIVGDDGLGYTVGVSGDKLSVSDHLVLLGMPTESLYQIPKFTHTRTAMMGRDTIIAGKFI